MSALACRSPGLMLPKTLETPSVILSATGLSQQVTKVVSVLTATSRRSMRSRSDLSRMRMACMISGRRTSCTSCK